MIAMTGLLVAGVVQAAPVGVASITEKIDNPGRVAVDAQGNLYVTEAAKNVVKKFSSKGRYLASLTVPRPLGIAADASGFLYIGSEGEKRVNVYDTALTFVRSIGTDVQKPNSVAVDATGMVYVTDTLRNIVKVYDPAGSSVNFVWGAAFRKPMGVAVNDEAGDIYVVDVPKLPTSNGETDGTRILVFNKSGAFQRTIGQSVGQQAKYTEVACDKGGTLYVTDSIANVFLFNSVTGAAQGTLSGSVKGIFNPKGIAISGNGLVYVASYSGKSIEVFGLDGYATMDVGPLSLTFVGTQYAGNPDPMTIVIANTGSGTLNWSATVDRDWITLGKQDPVGPMSAGGLAVGVNISAFVIGTQSGTIMIDSGFGQKQTVNVTAVVGPAPLLSISNGWLNFSAKKGTTPAAQGIALGIDNLTGPVAWSIASDSPSWLAVSPASGTISASAVTGAATVSVNTAGLKIGSYSGILTVSAPGVIGTGGKITVNLTVTPSTKINVNTNRPDATFSVSGPASYSGSGEVWSMEDVPAGDYTVTFNTVAGYKKPLPQAKSLAGDGEVTFGGTYASLQELAAKKNIVVAKGPGARNDALVKAYKNNGTPVAFDLVALSTRFGANVAVGDIDNDGEAELIVGAGDGTANPATVRVFKADKTQVLEFVPFGSLNGVRVTAADLNGDGMAEIIVSPAGGADNAGKVAVYTYDAAQKKMAATGIEFTAYTHAYGANIAAADIDGTGKPVIVTAPGLGKQSPALVKLWKVDTTPPVGKWTATLLKDISLGGAYGATVAAGDVDSDGNDEIIVGTSGDNAMVTIVKADGSRSGFKAFDKNTVNVAAADLDGDGIAEIIAAQGPNISQTGTADKSAGNGKQGKKKDGKEREVEYSDADQERGVVRVFSASGKLNFVIAPFEGAQDGINIAVGDLGI
jgi:hypothetical protein